MLRILNSKFLGVALGVSKEHCVANRCCLKDVTSLYHQISRGRYYHLRSMSTCNSSNNDNLVVYQGKLERQIIRAKLLSISTSVMGVAIQPYLYAECTSLPLVIAASAVSIFFTFVTPVLLHQLCKRHVHRVTYNKEKDIYVAHTTTFFFRDKQIFISPGEAKVPEIGGLFTNVNVRGIPLMIDMPHFDKTHLIKFLGYDKPLDLEHKRLNELFQEAEKMEKMDKESAINLTSSEEKRQSASRQ